MPASKSTAFKSSCTAASDTAIKLAALPYLDSGKQAGHQALTHHVCICQDLGEDPPNGNSLIHGTQGTMNSRMGAHRYGAFDPEDDEDDDDIRTSQVS